MGRQHHTNQEAPLHCAAALGAAKAGMDRTAEVEGPPEGDRTVARVPSAAPTTNRIGRFGLAEIALVLSIAGGGVFLYLVARGWFFGDDWELIDRATWGLAPHALLQPDSSQQPWHARIGAPSPTTICPA